MLSYIRFSTFRCRTQRLLDPFCVIILCVVSSCWPLMLHPRRAGVEVQKKPQIFTSKLFFNMKKVQEFGGVHLWHFLSFISCSLFSFVVTWGSSLFLWVEMFGTMLCLWSCILAPQLCACVIVTLLRSPWLESSTQTPKQKMPWVWLHHQQSSHHYETVSLRWMTVHQASFHQRNICELWEWSHFFSTKYLICNVTRALSLAQEVWNPAKLSFHYSSLIFLPARSSDFCPTPPIVQAVQLTTRDVFRCAHTRMAQTAHSAFNLWCLEPCVSKVLSMVLFCLWVIAGSLWKAKGSSLLDS